MQKFRERKFEFLIATDVAARGLDVDDLEVVFNFDLPNDAEDYTHRIGRTGRAGRSGRAFTFVSGQERLGAYVGELPVITDDRPTIEYFMGHDDQRFRNAQALAQIGRSHGDQKIRGKGGYNDESGRARLAATRVCPGSLARNRAWR